MQVAAFRIPAKPFADMDRAKARAMALAGLD